MSYDLIFLLEEESMKLVLETILPKLIPSYKSICYITHQGKQDLVRSIPRKIKVFQRFNKHTKFIIVHDQDSHNCLDLKDKLIKLCDQCNPQNVLIRIICRELESWFLGDLIAVEKAFELTPNTLAKYQNKQKFRNPDRLNSAKQELTKLFKKGFNEDYCPALHSRKIAPYLSLSQNRSHSFQIFIRGVKELLD